MVLEVCILNEVMLKVSGYIVGLDVLVYFFVLKKVWSLKGLWGIILLFYFWKRFFNFLFIYVYDYYVNDYLFNIKFNYNISI